MQWKTESSKESNINRITDKEINLNKHILCDLSVEGKESMLSCVERSQ